MAAAEAKLGNRKLGHRFWPGLRFKLFLSHSRPAVPKQGGESTSQEIPQEESAVPVTQAKGRLRGWTASYSFSDSILPRLGEDRHCHGRHTGSQETFRLPVPEHCKCH